MADGQFTCAAVDGPKCLTCGAPTRYFTSSGRPKKYCSTRCAWKEAPKQPRPVAAPSTCKQCGKAFRPKRKANSQYCSRECGFKGQRRRGPGKPRMCLVWFASCMVCGRAFAGRQPHAKYCSDGCRVSGAYGFRCRYCGTAAASRGDWSRTCGQDECDRQHEQGRRQAYREARRNAKRRRKARLRGVHTERVSRLRVFDQAGWRCQGCGCDTPKALLGSANERAPELDHVIPLAAGGSHSMANVQLLCRTCNQAKGAMMPSAWRASVWSQRG